jgi:hypothetical protein
VAKSLSETSLPQHQGLLPYPYLSHYNNTEVFTAEHWTFTQALSCGDKFQGKAFVFINYIFINHMFGS